MWWGYWAALALGAWLFALRKVLYRNTYLSGIDSTLASADNFAGEGKGLCTTIHCVFSLKQNVSESAFRELLVTKHLRHRRLQQRLVRRDWLWHYWQDVGAAFDLSQHFFVHNALPGAGGGDSAQSQDALERFVSAQLTTPLHPDRPLWEFHLIRNFGPAKDQSVVLFRVHHSLGDGVALMRIALTVFESKAGGVSAVSGNAGLKAPTPIHTKAGAARASASASPSPPLLEPSPSPSLLAAPASPASAPISPSAGAAAADDSKAGTRSRAAAAAADSKADADGDDAAAKGRAHHPCGKHKSRRNYCALLSGVLSSVVKLLVLPPDPESTLKSGVNMTPNTKINVRWSREPIPLAQLKAVSKSAGVSINDILTSCATGAIASYLEARSTADAAGAADGVVTRSVAAAKRVAADIQAVLWVSLRGLDLTLRKVDFSNRLGTVYLRLPLAVRDPLERLRVVQKQTAALIASPEAFVSYAIMSAIGFLPPALTRLIWFSSAFKVTLSMSNLPGPQQPLTFAGGDVERFIFFVPPVRTIGHFLCILSYADTVVCGLACDERLVDDPIALVHAFHAEVDKLKAAATAAPAAAAATAK